MNENVLPKFVCMDNGIIVNHTKLITQKLRVIHVNDLI